MSILLINDIVGISLLSLVNNVASFVPTMENRMVQWFLNFAGKGAAVDEAL